jgi:hypothetical protein
MVAPASDGEAQVAIPRDAGPIQLETLHLELGCGVLQIEARPCIVALVEEPLDRIDIDANVRIGGIKHRFDIMQSV